MGKRCKIDADSLERNFAAFDISYDEGGDILTLSLPGSPPSVPVECGGLFWIKVDPSNGNIMGIEIEHYRAEFLVRSYRESRQALNIRSTSNIRDTAGKVYY